MFKRLVFETRNEQGVFLHSLVSDRAFLQKAATAGEYHPKIADYIRQAAEIPGMLQLLVTAMGAGEYYGSNINGDWFGEDHLKYEGPEYGHKTFETMAKVFKHHVNKPDSPSYGSVALAVWNDKMKRVELILLVDKLKAPDIVKRIENGEYPELSMGCRVPYDVCSCCGNKAKTREEYCWHLKLYMNRIPPGFTRKAFAKNPWPKFHDISFVLIGADTIAKVMAKVASVHPLYGIGSADLAAAAAGEPIDEGLQKVAAAYGFIAEKSAEVAKRAEIKKEVPSNLSGNILKIIDEGFPLVRRYEPDIPQVIIIKMTSGQRPGIELVNRVLSNLLGAGIAPKHHELQDIILRGLGQHSLADDYRSRGLLFDPCLAVPEEEQAIYDRYLDISPRYFDQGLFAMLRPLLAERSYAAPLLHRRLLRIVASDAPPPARVEKTAELVGPLAMMVTLAGIYAALRKKDPVVAMSGFERLVVKHPAMAAALGAGLVTGFSAAAQPAVVGQTDVDPRTGIAARPVDLAGFIDMVNAKPLRGDHELAKTSSGLAPKIFLGVPALYTLSGLQEAYRLRHPDEEEGTLASVTRKHPDVLSAALVGEHLMGQPITRRVPEITQKVKGALSGGLSLLRKTAAVDAEAFALEYAGPEPTRAAELMESAILNNTSHLVHKWRS